METSYIPSESIIRESSDIAETLKELNKDDIEQDTKMTSIDTRTRLFPTEIPSMIAVDGLISLGFLPFEAHSITRSKKRLAVSRGGEGRKEWVQVASGRLEKAEEEKKKGFLGFGK